MGRPGPPLPRPRPVLDDRLAALEKEFVAIEAELAEPGTARDPDRLRELSIRHKELGEIVAVYRDLTQARADLQTATEMLDDSAGEDREVLRAEIDQAHAAIEAETATLQTLLLPKDPNDGRNVILEIRGAEGGEEANLFAQRPVHHVPALRRHSGLEGRGPVGGRL